MLVQPLTAYHRLNVYDYVLSFCGWEPIEELIKYAGNPRKELYVTSLIKTGGRAGEALSLTRENFTVDTRQKILLCQNMKLEKRYLTRRDPVTHKALKDDKGKRITETINAIRKPFPILLEEPLTDLLQEQLQSIDKGPLFTSPYKNHLPLTVSWGYKFIRNLNDSIPKSLFNKLGLNQPFRDKLTGAQLSDVIHLWQHWFRSQRASQLKAEYGFSESDLMEFFGWLNYATAQHYSRLGASNLAKKMRKALES